MHENMYPIGETVLQGNNLKKNVLREAEKR